MANIKSAKKRILVNDSKRLRNKSFKSSMKTAIKKVEEAIQAKDTKAAEAALPLAQKKIDKAVSKGLIHRNKANRLKSNLSSNIAKI